MPYFYEDGSDEGEGQLDVESDEEWFFATVLRKKKFWKALKIYEKLSFVFRLIIWEIRISFFLVSDLYRIHLSPIFVKQILQQIFKSAKNQLVVHLAE